MDHSEDGVSREQAAILEVLSLLSKKWQPVVLLTLMENGPLGFNELLKALPNISGNVLSKTLDELCEVNLVERRIVSESPLRVEYDLTTAGADMETIFEAAVTWSMSHLEPSTPTILFADGDRRVTDMYRQWLNGRYRTVGAHNVDELESLADAGADVVLVDEGVPGVDPTDLTSIVGDSCRTIVFVDDRPGVDLYRVDADDIRRKPIMQSTATEAIESQLRRLDEDAVERERAALAAKRSIVESCFSPDHLEADERYLELCERIDALDESH
ncbi:winged helix-turn-helix transcriptional regulator [Natrialbaceae archaeon A-chndr2]